MKIKTPDSHQRLSQILKQGDPAQDGKHMTSLEKAEMRQKILESIPETKPFWFLSPRLAIGLSAAGLAVLVITSLESPFWQNREDLAERPELAEEATPNIASQLKKKNEPEAGKGDAAANIESRPEAAGTTPSQADLAQPLQTADARSPRQIQFRTRNGIRVVWTLDPGFSL